MQHLEISQFGLAMIKRFEGLSLSVYPDAKSDLAQRLKVHGIMATRYYTLPRWQDHSGAPWTIGYGHVLPIPIPPLGGLMWATDFAEATLAQDIEIVTLQLQEILSVSLSQSQTDALVSLVFNIGIKHFEGSSILHWLRLKDFRKAGDGFLAWRNAGLLDSRRLAEKSVWDYGTI